MKRHVEDYEAVRVAFERVRAALEPMGWRLRGEHRPTLRLYGTRGRAKAWAGRDGDEVLVHVIVCKRRDEEATPSACGAIAVALLDAVDIDGVAAFARHVAREIGAPRGAS